MTDEARERAAKIVAAAAPLIADVFARSSSARLVEDLRTLVIAVAAQRLLEAHAVALLADLEAAKESLGDMGALLTRWATAARVQVDPLEEFHKAL